jgi:hypothetical protein
MPADEYSPADPYAERPTEVLRTLGLYRSGEAYPARAPERAPEQAATWPVEAATAHADTAHADTARAGTPPAELSYRALTRLRARLVRKYH